MTSEDFVSDTAEGFVSATAKLGIEGIKKLVEKLKNKKIAFVQDEKTIERVRNFLNRWREKN